MRLGDLYQLACAEKLTDQNPAPWSPPKAGIWATELIYIVCARTVIVFRRAVPLARGENLSAQAIFFGISAVHLELFFFLNELYLPPDTTPQKSPSSLGTRPPGGDGWE